MDTIKFEIYDAETASGIKEAVMIYINDICLPFYEHAWTSDEDCFESYRFSNHSGIDSHWILHSKHFWGGEESYDTDDGRTLILGCSCGDDYCSPFFVRITVKESTVVWSDFGKEYSKPLPEFGPFEFDKNQYFEELEKKCQIEEKRDRSQEEPLFEED